LVLQLGNRFRYRAGCSLGIPGVTALAKGGGNPHLGAHAAVDVGQALPGTPAGAGTAGPVCRVAGARDRPGIHAAAGMRGCRHETLWRFGRSAGVPDPDEEGSRVGRAGLAASRGH